MFERFTEDARTIIVIAQEQARELGHRWIGCEHLLLAIASTEDPVGEPLRDAGITPDRVRAEILRMMGPTRDVGGSVFDTIDREALATIGIDLDVVRGKVEEIFGPNALRPPRVAFRRRWWQPQSAAYWPASRPVVGHIPFTPMAKKCLELSLREALALRSGHIGAEHVALGLLATKSSASQHILSEIGVEVPTLRHDILERYRQAS